MALMWKLLMSVARSNRADEGTAEIGRLFFPFVPFRPPLKMGRPGPTPQRTTKLFCRVPMKLLQYRHLEALGWLAKVPQRQLDGKSGENLGPQRGKLASYPDPVADPKVDPP